MKIYGKMLKKIFGVATVSVALGATELKATFEEDVLKVCKRYGVNPKSKDMSPLLGNFNQLYLHFCKEVVKEENRLRANRWKGAVTFEDIGETLRLPTGEEVEVLKFCKRLWELILKYEKYSGELFSQEENRVFQYGCRFVFMRRMFEVVLICVRNFAEKFLSEENLFDKGVFKFNWDVAKNAMSKIWEHVPKGDDYAKLEIKCSRHLVQFVNSVPVEWNGVKKYKGSDFVLSNENEALDKKHLQEMIGVCREAAFRGSLACMDMIEVLSEARSQWQEPLMSSEKEAWKSWMQDVWWGCSESFWDMRKKYLQSEAERNKKIQDGLADIVDEKNEACDDYKKILEEFEALKKKRELLEAEVSVLRNEMMKICKRVEGGEKNDKRKKLGELEKSKKEKLSSLHKKEEESYQNMIKLTEGVEKRYEELSLEFQRSQKVNFASRALGLKDYVAYLRSFSYCHAHICNFVHQFITQRMSCAEKIIDKDDNVLGQIKCLKELQLTDDFEQEYILLVRGRRCSSSLDKRRSKIRMECEKSVLMNKQSLNTGFIRENNEEGRGKSVGLKRTKKI